MTRVFLNKEICITTLTVLYQIHPPLLRILENGIEFNSMPSGRGKTLPNGQKSQYIPLKEIAATEAAIQRGKELVRLQKRLENLSKMLG